MQSDNLIVEIRCMTCRSISEVTVLQSITDSNGFYKRPFIKNCPQCGACVEYADEVIVIQEYKDWRQV